MTMPTDELMATCWTSAGDAASDRPDCAARCPCGKRVEGRFGGRLRGFGLLSDDLPGAVATYGLNGIRDLLADNGIVHLELEGIPWWWDEGPHRAESDGSVTSSSRRPRCSSRATSR